MPCCLKQGALLTLFLLTGILSSHGQHARLEGRVLDTINNIHTPFLVALLRPGDSLLIRSTRSTDNGRFHLEGLPPGNFLIRVIHPKFGVLWKALLIAMDTSLDLGTLYPIPVSDTLAAVIVTPGYPPMHIRGDTLEFITTGIHLRPNASVEDLLKRLPGVEIDAQGGITINGQKIQKLMVDGVDLFGADPSLITRNFNADMIAKVQFLDKKSRQGEFTGVDDGQRTKTLNITLKEDRKQGYFGKAEAAAGSQGYYENNAILGSFKDKRQLAVIGKIADDGTTEFSGSFEEQGSELNLGIAAIDPLDATAGTGIPRVAGGAIHFANAWKEDQEDLDINYQLGHQDTQPVSSDITEQVLPDSLYLQNKQSSSVNSFYHQALALNYDIAPDSMYAFRLYLGGLTRNGHNQYSSSGDSYFNDTLVNNSLRTIQSDNKDQDFQGSTMARICSREKKDRVFSLTLFLDKRNSTTGGYLYSLDHFFRPDGSLGSADTTDQRKQISSSEFLAGGSLNYTEPLWKRALLALGYELSFNRNLSLLSTYGNADGKYDTLIDSLSNYYRSDLTTQKASLNIQSTGKSLYYLLGGDLVQYGYRQTDLLTASEQRYRYLNFIPRAIVRCNFSSTRVLSFDYYSSTQLPSISQLQPVQNNNDPLHIMLGNPGLKPSITHAISLVLQSLGAFSFNLGINYGFLTDGINTKIYTDSQGRQIRQDINTGGSEKAGLTFSTNKHLFPLRIDLGFHTELSYNRSENYVDLMLSRNDTYTETLGFSVGKDQPDKYNFRVHTNFAYSYAGSSINSATLTRYWTQNHNAELSVFTRWGLELNTNCNYTWRQKTRVFDKNNTAVLWSAFIGKNLLRNQLTLRWQINDILGQNIGINRTNIDNQVSETHSSIIGRYLMLSVIYRFMNQGKPH